MSREENTRHVMDATAQLTSSTVLGRFRSPKTLVGFLVGVWVLLAVLFVIFYNAFQNGPLSTGEPRPAPAREGRVTSRLPTLTLYMGFFGLVFGGSIGFALWKRRQSLRAYARGLQGTDSSELLTVVDGMFPRNAPMPDLEVYRVQARAVAHVLYGEVEQARSELARVSWEGKAPIVRALRHNVESLIHMLCTDEPARGLALAREALSMVDLPGAWPGAKTARAFYEVCMGLGECLTGEATPSTVQSLEQYHRSTAQPLSRLLSAHALHAAYQRAGDTARAESMRRFIQALAPHCRPFQQLPA